MNAATNQPPVLPNRLGHLSWAGHGNLLDLDIGLSRIDIRGNLSAKSDLQTL